ncbi:ABC transporter substrate-binding protein (plasmid) [Haloferax sp. S1W]|uniref:ABC transporter substrate-binding protein n=1 Tax=Haloferax sp. S1W TaxID=3377110 RepID=UPI0037CAD970
MSSIRLRRRSLLALAGLGLTSGCVRQFESAVSRDQQQPLSVAIKTVPADADIVATKIARYLATRLQQVGISATVVPMSREELLRSVLMNHDFDLYVYRVPLRDDPDFLRPLLHSRYAPDIGWQNPFGYGDLSLDSVLERQRTEHGAVRKSTLTEAQQRIASNQPFTPIAVPETVRAIRSDNVEWPEEVPLHSLSAYLTARPTEREAEPTTSTNTTVASTPSPTTATQNRSDPPTTRTRTTEPEPPETALRVSITDARPTENLNPLSTPFRSDGTIIRLLYDPLGQSFDGQVRPWMAKSWSWTGIDSNILSIRLRDDLMWHDGEPVSATDVVFTFDFLSDTSLGEFDQPVPSPRYRGRASLVEDVRLISKRDVRIQFGDVDEAVAMRALTVPVLPKHVWESYARPPSVPFSGGRRVTEALVRNNLEPVGSGPLQVTSSSLRESLTMEPFESHFLMSDSLGESLAQSDGGFSFDRLTFTVVPSDGAAIELLENDTIDATANSLSSSAAGRAREAPGLTLRTGQSQWCYHVGYNLRKPPFTNPRFRRAVSRLVDRTFLTKSLFDGDAEGVESVLEPTPFAPEGAQWRETVAELGFVGDQGTGELDTERARSLFEEAGYTYSSDSTLLVQE